MEVDKLQATVMSLVFVAIIVGVGLLTIDGVKNSAYTGVNIQNESFTWQNASNVSINCGTNITSFGEVRNGSNALMVATGNYTTTYITNFGTIEVFQGTNITCFVGKTCYAYYACNRQNTAAQTSLAHGSTALAGILNTWYGLIITVAILGLVIYLLLSGFGGSGQNRE